MDPCSQKHRKKPWPHSIINPFTAWRVRKMRIRNNRNLKARLFIIVLILFAIILILYGLTKEETKTYELCKNFKQEYYDFGSERISVICKINGEEKYKIWFHGLAHDDSNDCTCIILKMSWRSIRQMSSQQPCSCRKKHTKRSWQRIQRVI